MLILRDSSFLPENALGSVMALGNFDGLHRGHQAVIRETVATAKRSGKPAALMTFEPHPRRVFRPDLPTLRLLPFREKALLLREMGVDFLRVVRFTPAFSRTTAQQFVTEMLQDALQVSHVVTGQDFIFGHNREGDTAYLRRMAEELGFSYTACPPVLAGGERCSSTRIRALLASGEVEKAAQLLGRPYSITGRVRTGDKRGRQLGFPTANILPARIFTPAHGVYAVKARVRGEWVKGVANLGVRPTFGGKQSQLEAHLFDWEGVIYGERIEVVFVKRLREERTFDSVESLKAQIAEDSAQARAL